MRKLKLPVGMAVCGLLATALLVGRPIVHAQGGGPVLNPAQVLGPNVTFTWSAVAGASSYVLRAGIAPGQYLLAADIGNTTTYLAQAPAVATYFVRVDAVVGGVPVPSNEISFQVVWLSVPPAAPTNLAAYANGVAALLTGLESRTRRRDADRVASGDGVGDAALSAVPTQLIAELGRCR